jgi:hypothetical protein
LKVGKGGIALLLAFAKNTKKTGSGGKTKGTQADDQFSLSHKCVFDTAFPKTIAALNTLQEHTVA